MDTIRGGETIEEYKERTHAVLRAEAEAAAARWEPFTQNHCPSYWKALREAYAQGFSAGVSAEEKRSIFNPEKQKETE